MLATQIIAQEKYHTKIKNFNHKSKSQVCQYKKIVILYINYCILIIS